MTGRLSVARALFGTVMVGVLVLGALGLPAQPAPMTPTPGGTLTIAFVPLRTHIDVNAVNTSTVNELAHYFYETLYDREESGKVKGLLVKEDQVSADGLTWTFKLQPGVRFHDGTPFNAAAVKWNLERKIQKKQPLWDFLPFKTIEAIDDLTVRATLTRTAANLRAILVTKTFSMYSPAFVQQVGDNAMLTRASGTGPYTVSEFRSNENVALRKNPNYWQKGLPYFDQVIYRVVPDNNARAAGLEAGDVDMAVGLSVPDSERLKTKRGFKVQEALGSQQYYIAINTRRPPLNDVRVRQALNHAVDKEGIIKTVLLGNAKVATAVYINPTVDGYVRAGTYPYDPEKAKKLLEEAGWAAGPGGVRQREGRPLTLDFLTRKGGSPGDFEIAELVQGMLKAVGVDVRLQVLESATFLQRVTVPPERSTYDLVNLAVGTFTGDAEYTMLTFYHTNSAAPRYFNRAYYSNPLVDSLIEESMKPASTTGRNKIYYAQIIKQVFSDAPIIMLFDVTQSLAMKETIRGVYLEPASNVWAAKYAWRQR